MAIIFKNRSAWIIEWKLHRQDSPINKSDLRPYILPYRWKIERVLDFMRCIYWNSSLVTPSETLMAINKRKPKGLFIRDNQMPITYGDATYLFANIVRDLRIERDQVGQFVIKWTDHSRVRRWAWKRGRWIEDADSLVP